MTNKKVVVTGGAGFIGSHLVEELVALGNNVTVVDTLLRGNKIPTETLKQIQFHQLDVCNQQALSKLCAGADCIFHFAAILGVDIVADNPVETMETEVNGMQSVAHAAIDNNISKIIYASTSGVYGHHALEKSVTEDIMIDPRTSYAMAKRFNEIYLAALYEEKGIHSVALRFFNVYGQRQDNRMVVPRFFEQAISSEPITVFGSGNQTRDFTWVKDAVRATISLAEKAKGFEIFNVSNEAELDIATLAHKIKKVTNSTSEINFIDAPAKRYDYEVGRRFGSSDKLFKQIGYKPSTAIDSGLATIYHQLTGS
jgi:UDP-glucose 4-epimerase